MALPTDTPAPVHSTPSSAWAATWSITLLAITLGVPTLGILLDAARAPDTHTATIDLAVPLHVWARTAGWAVSIGLLATLVGLPLAWAARPLGSRWAAPLLLPLFFPMYLAYAGWGMLRAPATSTGAWLASLTADGRPWLPATIDAALALLGLSLWAAPLAALLILPALRRIDDELLESLRLESTRLRRSWESLRLCAPALAAASLGVAALMLGSVIPLHLAKIDTASVSLWARLDLLPFNQHWRIWAAGWPLAIAAFAAGIFAVRAATLAASDASILQPHLRSTGVRILSSLIILVAVGVPALLYARVLTDPAALSIFFRVHGGALAWSLAIAATIALLAACQILALAHWLSSHSRTARAAACLLVAGGLVPGVMLGSAVSRAWASLPFLDDLAQGPAIVLAMHLARVGPVVALAAVWIACSEPTPLRDARRLDNAESLSGWFFGRLLGNLGPLALASLAAAALSLHDIESSVMVQPPGVPSLPRKILNDLHFFRTQEIAAALLSLLAISTALLSLAFYWLARSQRAASRPEISTMRE